MSPFFRRSLRHLGLGMSILALAVLSFGQNYVPFESERELIRQTAKWRLGPFHIAPLFLLRNVGHDTNVYGVRAEDHPTGDITATVSPQIKAYLVFRNWLILSLLENPEYVYFAKQKGERSLNNNLSPSFRALLFYRFSLSGEFHYRKARRRATSEFDVRADEKIKGASAGIFYETPRQTALGISWSVNRFSYENTQLPGQVIYLSRALDRLEKNVMIEGDYRLFSQSYLFFTAGSTDYRFDFAESAWKDSHSFQAYTGIRFPLPGRARGMLSLGYKKFSPRHRELASFSGLVGNTSLDLRISRFAVRLRYNRDCNFSYSLENIFFVENLYGGGGSFYLTEFLRLDYDLAFGTNRYPEEILLPLPGGGTELISRRDRVWTHTAGFVFRVFRDIGLGLTWNSWSRSSNYLFEGNRSRSFVGGYLTYEF